jgi:BASS family bile acid:Na+ symporter
MHEILTKLLPLAIAVFLFSAMFSVGLDLTIRQIVEPLRNKRLVAVSMIANIVLVPLAALGLAGVIPMDGALKTGFLLYAFSAGTEAGPKLAQLAKGNAAFAVGLLAVLIVTTIVFVPMAVSLVVPDAHVERGKVLAKLLLVVALPMGIGLYLRARHQALAARLSPAMHRLSTSLLFLVFAQLIFVNYDEILAVEAGALLAGLLLFAIAFAIGHALGGPEKADRRALAIMTFVRAGTISMMIAGQVFAHEPKVLVMATVMTSLSVVLGVLTTVWLSRSPA